MILMLHAPNTFIQFWTAKELRDWHRELRARERGNWPAYLCSPTRKQVLAELRRRGLTLTAALKPEQRSTR